MAPMMNSLADNLPESNPYIRRERLSNDHLTPACVRTPAMDTEYRNLSDALEACLIFREWILWTVY